MKLGIMQPYFLPYIGYFQLLRAVDQFVIYDNIQFTKKGWIRHNKILVGGKETKFSIPIKSGSDYLHIVERQLADNFDKESKKILRRIEASYKKAPYYKDVMPLVVRCFQYTSNNLFDFIYQSLQALKERLGLETELIVSSAVDIDHRLKSQDKVLALSKKLGADLYVNPIGGVDLYSPAAFHQEGIELRFLRPKWIEYRQFDHEFVPYLSIVDIMMFNPMEKIHEFLCQYELIQDPCSGDIDKLPGKTSLKEENEIV